MSKLYLIPTPIGNLEDITLRAIRILKEADVILAEDTRTSRVLLNHLGIDKRLLSHHQHNEHQSTPEVIRMIQAGQSVALISDAGTPGISDPGFLIIRSAMEAGIKVSCLPGPVAFVPAMVASGIPCDKFFFEGFLPHKKGRQTRLKYLSGLDYTFILYESPHRLIKCLEELKEHCTSMRLACVAREISKVYEEIKTATIQELVEYYKGSSGTVKGEIVIVVSGTKTEKYERLEE